ncbi:MAG TPA: HdeD family acid-resistance protein [Myxococcaceae bacterium]|nr:HdeD family acid-resistance protein [Myxococcaceae bacterium]
MIHELARNWGWIALRGALAIVFGVLALAWPASAFAAIVVLFGAYAFVDGVFALVALFRGAGRERFWMLVIEAVVGIGIGILTIVRPAATALALLYYVGIWSILTGIFELVAAIRLRKEITGEFWLGLAGVLSIVFGVVLFAAPGPAALALAVWIGVYAIVFGVMLLLLAFRLRRFSEGHRTPGGTGRPATVTR